MNNWDTKETWLWITNEEQYYTELEEVIENEMRFIFRLYAAIEHINSEIKDSEMRIDSAKVNGNEIYVEMSKLLENEQQGWCRNETQK